MKKWVWLLAVFASACAGSLTPSSRLPPPIIDTLAVPELVIWMLCPSPCVDRSPRFALYPDGTLIYARLRPVTYEPAFLRTVLTPEQHQRLLSPERMQALAALEPAYFVSNGTHAPDHVIQWRTADGLRQVEVNGILEDSQTGRDRKLTPPAFLALFDDLTRFNPPDAAAYVPTATQVDFWPMKASGGDSVGWPESWTPPAFLPGTERTRGAGELRATMPGPQFTEVYGWLLAREEKGQAVSYQGQQYYNRILAILPGAPTPLAAPPDLDGP